MLEFLFGIVVGISLVGWALAFKVTGAFDVAAKAFHEWVEMMRPPPIPESEKMTEEEEMLEAWRAGPGRRLDDVELDYVLWAHAAIVMGEDWLIEQSHPTAEQREIEHGRARQVLRRHQLLPKRLLGG